MKRTQKASWFVAGMLCTAILVNTVAPAAAALVAKTIQVYTGIEVFVDDKRIDAGETHGNPDAFAYNGTTYVAVAAISKSLGEKVYWDGENKKVYIGDHDGVSYDFLSVCTPYRAGNSHRVLSSSNANDKATLVFAGKQQEKGLLFDSYSDAFYNLNGQYDTLTFTLGLPDNFASQLKYAADGRIYIYLDKGTDNEESILIQPDPYGMPQTYTVDLNGATQMQINVDKEAANFVAYNMKIS